MTTISLDALDIPDTIAFILDGDKLEIDLIELVIEIQTLSRVSPDPHDTLRGIQSLFQKRFDRQISFTQACSVITSARIAYDDYKKKFAASLASLVGTISTPGTLPDPSDTPSTPNSPPSKPNT